MARNEEILQRVCGILGSRREKYAWKTARYLAGQLRKEHLGIAPKALDALLEEYAESDDAVIRYSAFPARRNLDTLWGHKSIVGELDQLPRLTLDEEHEFFGRCRVSGEAPWCFLSHNHRDLKTVVEVRDHLLERGYGVWIFEAEIALHTRISDEVRKGLENSDRFLVYASRFALQSRWVLKEILTGLSAEKTPHVIVNVNDPDLVDFFVSWLTTGWEGIDLNWESRRLLEGIAEPKEQVAITPVATLLGAMRDMCPESERRLVLYPGDLNRRGDDLPVHPHLYTFDQAFPPVAGNGIRPAS